MEVIEIVEYPACNKCKFEVFPKHFINGSCTYCLEQFQKVLKNGMIHLAVEKDYPFSFEMLNDDHIVLYLEEPLKVDPLQFGNLIHEIMVFLNHDPRVGFYCIDSRPGEEEINIVFKPLF